MQFLNLFFHPKTKWRSKWDTHRKTHNCACKNGANQRKKPPRLENGKVLQQPIQLTRMQNSDEKIRIAITLFVLFNLIRDDWDSLLSFFPSLFPFAFYRRYCDGKFASERKTSEKSYQNEYHKQNVQMSRFSGFWKQKNSAHSAHWHGWKA